jgi:hypothetical protein
MSKRSLCQLVTLGVASFVLMNETFAQTEPSKPSTPPAAETQPASAADEAKELARGHFTKGVAYQKQEQWGAALTEFLEARRLYPESASSTRNAVVCLQKLQRYDEALDLYETLLRDYGDRLPKDAKENAEKHLAEVRALVSTVDVKGALEGASIIVNGRFRGTTPLPGPLRIGPGHHEIRAYKEGYDPYGASVDVTGQQAVDVTLTSLSTGGRLRVVEQRGRPLDVVLDGVVVGKTPWEGGVAVGEHVVLLRGSIDLDALPVCSKDEMVAAPGKLISTPLSNVELGTQPVQVRVELRELSTMTLTAESLDTWIRIEPTPAGATVAIDSEVVGRGTWEGRLRVGEHKVEFAAEGFVPETRIVKLESRKRKLVKVALGRDPFSELWRKPGSLVPAGVSYGVALAGLGAFGVTGILALNTITDVRSNCQDTLCPTDQANNIESARTFGTISTLGLVVGGVGLAAGTFFLFKRPGATPPPPAARRKTAFTQGFDMDVGFGLGAIQIKGRF